MNDSPPQPRRSPSVVLLDAFLGLVTAVQTGNLPGRRRAGLIWLAAGVLVVAGGTTILVGALMRAPGGLTDLTPPGKAAPAPPPPVTSLAAPATATTPTHRVSAAASESASATPVTSGPVAKPSAANPVTSAGSHLTAAYAAANGSGLLGYQATVTLAAEGPSPSADWRLTITLPRTTLQVAAVDGATVERDGAVWTFTPDDATRQIAAGTSAVISFEVRGATLVDAQPTDCRVNDEVCSGLTR
ncbi:cellulose binding domain-containing protein [Actinoplanes sp. CA-142083]|uniref:cellulose binding domain-containing protein n=1 Tax=Actinoplanes sp. CA-142083 TaxID=3239903 RepID=UPI003D90A386